ncbi:MAG: tyrosine-type recombinase/integrase [Thermovirgaceae bacterium]
MGRKDRLAFSYCNVFLESYLPVQLMRSKQTVTAYVDALSLFRRFAREEKALGIEELTLSHIDIDFLLDFRLWLTEVRKVKPQTANQRLSLVMGYLRYCSREDVSFASTYLRLAAIPPLRCDKPDVPPLTEKAVSLILAQPPQTDKGLRDRTFMILLYELAARVSEVVGLRLSNLMLEGSSPHIQLLGKGNKRRNIPVTGKTLDHLRRYLEVFHPEMTADRLLFYTVAKGVAGPLSLDCVDAFLKKYAAMAHGLDPDVPERIHSHQFRKGKATHLSDKGVSLPVISRFLGHADISTTMVYVKPNQEKIREALLKAEGPGSPSPEQAREYEALKARLYGLR